MKANWYVVERNDEPGEVVSWHRTATSAERAIALHAKRDLKHVTDYSVKVRETR